MEGEQVMRSLENPALNVFYGSESWLRGKFDFNKILDVIAKWGKGSYVYMQVKDKIICIFNSKNTVYIYLMLHKKA